MPFGNESAWDFRIRGKGAGRKVGHQCLSAMSPLGTSMTYICSDTGVESPMPFGNESAWDNQLHTLVSVQDTGHQCLSAMSPLGTPQTKMKTRVSKKRHQCLSAMSPLGTRGSDGGSPRWARVTNAFRQ